MSLLAYPLFVCFIWMTNLDYREGVNTVNQMIRGAIFDVDGTLLDSMGIWKDAGKRYLNKMNIEAEEGLGQILYPMTIEEGAEYLKHYYNLPLTTDEVRRGVLDIVHDFYFYEAELMPYMRELLEEFSKADIPMIIATSSDELHIEAALRRLGVLNYFTSILTCSEIGAGKHYPDIYLRAADSLGTRPDETVVFEDALYAVETARNAGFITVNVSELTAADWGHHLLSLNKINAK